MRSLLHETLVQGYKHFKINVGESGDEDRRRLRTAHWYDVIGYDKGSILMVDANQNCPPWWSVNKEIKTDCF